MDKKQKRLKDLKPNPKNPRKISSEKLGFLKQALEEFGDLSGIVFNTRTGHIVGGHQRHKVLPDDAQIAITKQYDKPTRTGTTAMGYVIVEGERYSYREVMWDINREKAANIAANRGAGEWDIDQLNEWLADLDNVNFDLDLTMFSADERESMRGRFSPEAVTDSAAEEAYKSSGGSKAVCPHCGAEFSVAGRR